MSELRQVCLSILQLSQKKAQEAHRGDASIGDISRSVGGYLKSEDAKVVFLSEETGKIELSKMPEMTVVFRDLDPPASLLRGDKVLPYCSSVSVLDGATPRFSDCLAAGIVEHLSGRIWLAEKHRGCSLAMGLARTSGAKEFGGGQGISLVAEGAAGTHFKGIRALDFGSSLLHLAGVGSGMFDLFLGKVPAASLAAGYLVVKEAGGAVVERQGGTDMGPLRFHFDETYPVIAAASNPLAEEAMARLTKADY